MSMNTFPSVQSSDYFSMFFIFIDVIETDIRNTDSLTMHIEKIVVIFVTFLSLSTSRFAIFSLIFSLEIMIVILLDYFPNGNSIVACE